MFRPLMQPHQASSKTGLVPRCAHNMGSHTFTCVGTRRVKEHQLKSLRNGKNKVMQTG